MASLCKRQQYTIKGHGFHQELHSWWHKLLQFVDLPSFSDPLIPPVAQKIMQRMIQKLAKKYTSETSSTQDIPSSQSVPNSTKYQSLLKASLVDPAASTLNCLFGYTDSATIIAASSKSPLFYEIFMADQDSPLDLTVKKTGVKFSSQDGVLDLSTKKKQNRISFEPAHDFPAIPVVKRLPVTDQKYIDDKDGLAVQGLQDGIWEKHTRSAAFKPLLSKSLFIKEELLNHKHRFLGQPSSLSLSNLETVGFVNSHQTHPLWEKPSLDDLRECKPASSHIGDLKNLPLILENHGSFIKGTSACHSTSFDILAITPKNDARSSSPVDLKIPQVKGVDCSWNANGNISDTYHKNALNLGSSVQTDNSLNRRLRAILPKQKSIAGSGSLFDGGGISENLGNESTSGIPYPTSDPEGDPTVSKQPRKKRGRYRQYNSEILEEAIGVVMSGKMSVSKAQNIYGIPHSTLEYKVKERMGTLKNPPKKKLKIVVNNDSTIAPETKSTSAETSTSSTVQKDVL